MLACLARGRRRIARVGRARVLVVAVDNLAHAFSVLALIRDGTRAVVAAGKVDRLVNTTVFWIAAVSRAHVLVITVQLLETALALLVDAEIANRALVAVVAVTALGLVVALAFFRVAGCDDTRVLVGTGHVLSRLAGAILAMITHSTGIPVLARTFVSLVHTDPQVVTQVMCAGVAVITERRVDGVLALAVLAGVGRADLAIVAELGIGARIGRLTGIRARTRIRAAGVAVVGIGLAGRVGVLGVVGLVARVRAAPENDHQRHETNGNRVELAVHELPLFSRVSPESFHNRPISQAQSIWSAATRHGLTVPPVKKAMWKCPTGKAVHKCYVLVYRSNTKGIQDVSVVVSQL